MANLSFHHQNLIKGVGKCSVPMWCRGLPSGFCDKPAYGFRPYSKEVRLIQNGYVDTVREDGKYAGYVPALACPIHGGPSEA